MSSLRHFGPSPEAGQPAAELRYRAKAAADQSQNHALMSTPWAIDVSPICN